MGALKINYYLTDSTLDQSPLFLEKGLKEKGTLEKNRANYYPFGSPLPGRQLIAGDQYEHGYQGQYTERDEETGLDAFELRMWDSRLARWTSTDPYGQFHSPYLGMGNNPVSEIDPDGGLSGAAWGAIAGTVVGGTAGYIASDGDWGWALAGAGAGALGGYAIGGKISKSRMGNPIEGGKSGFLAKGTGFVSEDYLASLADKATRHAWAASLLPQVISRTFFDYNSSDPFGNRHIIPDLGKVGSASFNLNDGTGPNRDLVVAHNDEILIAGNDISPRQIQLRSPRAGDRIRVVSGRTVGFELNRIHRSIMNAWQSLIDKVFNDILFGIHKVSHGIEGVNVTPELDEKTYRIPVSYD